MARRLWSKLLLGITAGALASILVLSACAKQAVESNHSGSSEVPHSAQVHQILTLPSGYRLRIIQIGPVYSTTTHRVLAVMLAYETDIPVNDVKSLAHEADGIFKYFNADAERGGYSSAILSATEPAQGFAGSGSSGYRFVYERNPSGEWRRTNGPNSESVDKPQTSVSTRATEWLNRCIVGDWDWKQFGSGLDDTPANPAVRYGITHGFRKLLEPRGAVRSMQYLGRRSFVSDEGHHRTVYRYQVGFEHGVLIYEFAQDSDGYVGGVAVGTNALSVTYWR